MNLFKTLVILLASEYTLALSRPPNITSVMILVTIGEEAKLCLETYNPLVIKWEKDVTYNGSPEHQGDPTFATWTPSLGPWSTSSKYNFSENGGCLRIFNVSEKDEGVYVCTVTYTSYHTETSTFEVQLYETTTSKQEAITQASNVSTVVSTTTARGTSRQEAVTQASNVSTVVSTTTARGTSRQEAVTQASNVSTPVSTTTARGKDIPHDEDEPPKTPLIRIILAVGIIAAVFIFGVSGGVLMYWKWHNKTDGERSESCALAFFPCFKIRNEVSRETEEEVSMV
ncbi:uncharacterized protein [Diadema setosum]|uniref:uncharacterized protein isoform X2 n=1 Tax=Diadema setosum TaxID=31175 RepID=UPI003B3BAC41